MARRRLAAAAAAALLVPGLAAAGSGAPEPAERIYLGSILTVDADDRVAEALAVGHGEILAVGPRERVLALRGPDTRVVELGERAVLPGFVDAHGHFLQTALASAMVNLAPPPVGPVASLADLQRELSRRAARPPGDGWILGGGYDDALLAEGRAPTRDDLDRVSPDRPICVVHVSGHLLAANSAALARAGITAETPDPPGGVIRRRPGSREPDGVLEEHAMFLVLSQLPVPDLETGLALVAAAQREYASHGITTAQEGALTRRGSEALLAAAEGGRLSIDVVAYAYYREAEELLAAAPLPGRLRLGGVKLVLDGSPQGKTAWLTRPYLVPPSGRSAAYRGYPALPDAEVDALVDGFFTRRLQVLAHANGDAAADQLIGAVARATERHGPGDRRTVMIHAQTVREDQLDRMAELGILPSFFVSHTFFWGDWHRDSVLGPERAARISPAASAARRGIRMSFHADAPVTPPDPIRLLWSAVNRRTRSGRVLGPEQRVSVARALRALTIDAAYAHFEEARKGSIEPGKLADLVILSASPLRVAPEALLELRVLETVKEGESVYRASVADAAGLDGVGSAARR